jgi:hypothetical protein
MLNKKINFFTLSNCTVLVEGCNIWFQVTTHKEAFAFHYKITPNILISHEMNMHPLNNIKLHTSFFIQQYDEMFDVSES